MSKKVVTIIGGGLAGSEAAYQISKAGFNVRLHEMRPKVMTKAHKTGSLAELVCSNSFRGADLTNAVGLLKEELRILDSLIMQAAEFSKVPAGGALAVDRILFSAFIEERIKNNPLIEICTDEIQTIPESSPESPVIIATGPLTSLALSRSIETLLGEERFSFFDAISPIILGESIDFTKVFRQSRYDKGEGSDYLNIPLSKEQYYEFVEAVRTGEKSGGHEDVESDSIENLKPFEGCMPIEEMIERGPETLRFGPFKPMGLTNPVTGKRPYAVAQLRQDDADGKLWNMVGMQTRLKHGEQLRIFRTLPGLENAEFVRLGTVHRNSFINSPTCLDSTLHCRKQNGLFFAGQITGVEGYVESTAGGLVAGINAVKFLRGETLFSFPGETAIGSLMNYISDKERKDFQPMNISFGLMPSYLNSEKRGDNGKKITKTDRRLAAAENSLKILRSINEK